MKMICEVPDEVIKCIKDGTWCGSSVAEKMIANGIPLSSSEEPCEDAISRQAAKKALEDRFMELQKRHDDKRYETNYCLNTILELPSVNPQKPICPSARVDCEDCPAYEKKSECEHDHEILKAYSDGASAVLESIKYLIEQYEHYLELLDADMKDGSATIVTKTKYAVYAEVVEQLKEVLESEVQE